jgi:hypothetical protein
MHARLLLVCSLVFAMPALAAASCLRPGTPDEGIPEWKLKLILAYPVAKERGEMLYAALGEHYAIDAINSADGPSLVRLLLPGMLEAKTPDTLGKRVAGAMDLLNCTQEESPGTPQQARADQSAIPAAAADPNVTHDNRHKLALPTTLPTRASSDARGQKSATTSSELLAFAATKKKDDDKLDAAAKASDQAIRELKSNVGAMKSAKSIPACCNGRTSSCPVGDSPCVPLADRTEDMLLASRRSYDVVQQANVLATSPGASGQAAEQIKTDFGVAKPLMETAVGIGAARLPRYGIYAGPSYTLQGDGGWHAGSEFVARFESAVHDRSRWCWFGNWCRTASEFSYRSIGALDDSTASPQEKNANGEEPPINPFTSSGGIFRYTGAYQIHFDDWIGVMGVFGLTATDPGDSKRPELRTRVGIGGHFQTLYGDGALGQLYFGYMRDAIWERNVPIDPTDPALGLRKEHNNNRWVVDGLFFLPGIDIGGFQVAARLTADAPMNKRGPSDVRASLLFHYDLNSWLRRRDPHKSKDDSN